MDKIKYISNIVIAFFFFGFVQACNSQEQPQKINFKSHKQYEETMIASHKKFVESNSSMIKAFTDSSQYKFTITGSGLRYTIIKKGSGMMPKEGDEVNIKYSIQFLDGEKVLEFEQPKKLQFVVGKSDVESGLHEALQLMHVGDSGLFIFPPHLAFGISGNRKDIPPQSTLLYSIELIAIR